MTSPAVLEGRTSVEVADVVTAPKEPANFVVSADSNEVAHYIRQGDNLIIGMKSGESYTIKNFVRADSSGNNLIFNHEEVITQVDLSSALTSVNVGVLSPELIKSAALTNSISLNALLKILGMVTAAGGGVLASKLLENESKPGDTPSPAREAGDNTPTTLAAPQPVDNSSPDPSFAITNQSKPRVHIGAGLTDEPKLYVDGVRVGSIYDSASGILTPAGDLQEGVRNISYTLTNSAGIESGPSSVLTITVDITPPVQTVSITAATDDTAPVTGSISSGGKTDDTAPLLSGNLSAVLGAGESIQILRDGTVVGEALVDGTGWTYAASGLTDGHNYSYTARVVDAAGNHGPTSSTFTINIDTIAPQAPSILQMSNDTEVANDFASSATETIISGRAEADSVVHIHLDGALLGTVTVGSTGVWQSPMIDLSSLAAGDTITVTAMAIDAAGNASEASTKTITKTVPSPLDSLDVANLTQAQGFTILGDSSGVALGMQVSAAGDVNGDGTSDVIVSALAANGGGSNSGEAYVIFGSTAGFGAVDDNGRIVIDTANLSANQGFLIRGDTDNDRLGYSVSSAGDVNGDHIDDIIVSALFGDDGGTNAGEAYVIFGSTNGFGTADGNGRMVIDTTNLSAIQGFIIQGDTSGDAFGQSVSYAGDVNGDGVDDLIVGATGGDDGGSNAGEAYVIFGSTTGFGTPDGNNRMVIDTTNLLSDQGFIIRGGPGSEFAGVSVSFAGDINNDNIADLIIGAHKNAEGGADAGAAYVIFGSTNGFGTDDGSGRMAIDTSSLLESQGFIIQGETANDYFGWSVSSLGDVNGDDIDDLIVGAPGNAAGAAYVIFGSTTGFGTDDGSGRMVIDTKNLGNSGFIIQGRVAADRLGGSVSSVGDFNGDGINDIVVGAALGDQGGADAGEAYVIFGNSNGTFGAFDATTNRWIVDTSNLGHGGFAIHGDTDGDQFGISVSGAGDMNSDGFADLIVGAYGQDSGGSNAGAAYIIYGFAATLGRVETGSAAADFFAGTSASDNLTGGGGADVLLGYAGNDTLTVSDTSFAHIDGGEGHDKLVLSGSGLHLDLTMLKSDVITNIEQIDITGTGDNRLTLTAQDLLDLSSTTDTLIVDGNTGDTVRAIGFTDSGTDQTIGSVTYDVYTSGTATLWLDKQINNVVLT